MALRPADSLDNPRGPGRAVEYQWRPAKNQYWDDLVELRLRTIEGVPDDPLAHVDWWAWIHTHIEATPTIDAPRNATRLVDMLIRSKRMPTGIWSVKRTKSQRTGWAVAVRFEGYRPWWERGSAWVWSVGYAQRMAVTYERGEPHTLMPRIADEEYADQPVPDHILNRLRLRMVSQDREERNYDPYDEEEHLAPWGEVWRQRDRESREQYLAILTQAGRE